MLAGTRDVPCLMKLFERENAFKESARFNVGQQSKSFIEIGCRASNGSDDGFVVADNGFEAEVSPGVWQTQQQNGCAGFGPIKNRIQCFSVSCCFDDRVEGCNLLKVLFDRDSPARQVGQSIRISIENRHVGAMVCNRKSCQMADWSSADHGRTTQHSVRRIPTQTAETLEYDSQGLAKDRMLERQRRWQPVNKTRRSNHIFGV